MALFTGKRDISLYRSLNRQLITKIMGTTVNYYKLSIIDTKVNIYQQGIQKIYFPNVKIAGIIDFRQVSMDTSQMGTNFIQALKIKFDRLYLKQKQLYPQIGDVIQWNNNYYQIASSIENQFIAGQTQQQYNWSIICQCNIITNNIAQIDQINQYIQQKAYSQTPIPQRLYR